MVIEQALSAATQQLKAAQIAQPRFEANVLMQYVLKCDRAALLRMQTDTISEEALAQYTACVSRRCAGEPTAYIVGQKEFMSLTFQVSDAVLIPRPDTEILCEAILARAAQYTSPKILDLCCGSGCIGISLAHYMPSASVTLMDLSDAAVAVATENARALAPDNTTVVCGDALALQGQFDIIASNPPYIETAVIEGLQTEVRDYEPRMALDGGADGLRFYTHFAETAQRNLNAGGMLALEVGHTQAQTVFDLLCANGWQRVEICKDLAGIERVVLGYKN